jgi:mRNA interferase HigB
LKRQFPSASILDNERVVFNLAGNSYRVVVMVKYQFHVVYIRFIGTHAEYDKVDAANVQRDLRSGDECSSNPYS